MSSLAGLLAGRLRPGAPNGLKGRLLFCVGSTLLLIVGLQAARVLFYLQYSGEFAGVSPWVVFQAFAVGLRFDAATAVIVSAPVMLLFLLPGLDRLLPLRPLPGLLRLVAAGLLLWHLLVLVYTFIDVQYYAFVSRHLTFEISNTWQDAGVFVQIGVRDYMGFTIGLLVFLALYVLLFAALVSRTGLGTAAALRKQWAFAGDLFVLVVFAALCIVVARGGFQMKPLGLNDAYFSEEPSIGALALNGVYTTLDSFNNGFNASKSLDYGEPDPDDKAEVTRLIVAQDRESSAPGYPLLRQYNYAPEQARRMNVVVFIMESWSAKFTGALGGEVSATPFFDSLAPKGLIMENCLANAQRSVEGLPAVLGSLPSWSGLVFGRGGLFYQSRLIPVPLALARDGYTTLFAHGAPADSMGFEGIIKRLGFVTHVSMKDFPEYRKHHDGVWGVYDEHAFVSLDARLRKLDTPFFAATYSLSSHTPYTIPSDKFRFFDKGVEHADFLNSIRYSDYSLGRFFELAAQSPYFENTLFVITSDHTEGRSTGGRDLRRRYQIPCFFYTPGGQLEPGRSKRLAGQVDIMPTVLDILRLSTPFTGWGRSMLSPGARVLVLPHGERYIYVRGDNLLYADTNGPLAFYDYTKDPKRNLLRKKGSGNAFADEMYEGLRRYLRFSYGLIRDNKVTPARVTPEVQRGPTSR